MILMGLELTLDPQTVALTTRPPYTAYFQGLLISLSLFGLEQTKGTTYKFLLASTTFPCMLLVYVSFIPWEKGQNLD